MRTRLLGGETQPIGVAAAAIPMGIDLQAAVGNICAAGFSGEARHRAREELRKALVKLAEEARAKA